MKFPWYKYEELPIDKRNTLQIFITNRCNLKCEGCFARHATAGNDDMSLEEYTKVVKAAVLKGVKQINILGGEPTLHPGLALFCRLNISFGLKTTIYTNGLELHSKWSRTTFPETKIRVSVDGLWDGHKPFNKVSSRLQVYNGLIDINYMVSSNSTVQDMIDIAETSQHCLKCNTFFISSYRYLDDNTDFFSDTQDSMPVLKYKALVHEFLEEYDGNLEIHISKRGVFESTMSQPHNQCKFANYLIGGKIIQCPYDLVNLKFQDDYEFDTRYCQQNNSCLMSKIKVRRRV